MSENPRLAWDHLQSFLAIAREGSLSAAARSLHVNQSTMGRRLETLHREIGTRLVDRTPDGYVLTDAGCAVLMAVERMEAGAFDVERSIARECGGMAGEVRITTVEAFGAKVIAPMLGPLLARSPGLSIEFITDVRDLSLSRRECDIALRLGEFELNEAVVQRVGRMVFGLYASRAYLDGRGDPMTGDGAGHDLVTAQRDLAAKPEASGLVDRFPQAQVRLRANSRQVQLEAVAAGCGVGMLPCHLASTIGGLVELGSHGERVRRDIWLGIHRDNRDVPRIRRVVDDIIQGMRAVTRRMDP